MLYKFVSEISFVEYYIFFSAIAGFLFANYKKQVHKYLLVILVNFVLTEIALIYANVFDVSVAWIYAPSIFVHNIFWFLILKVIFKKQRKFIYLILGYVFFSLFNVVLNGFEEFDILSFIIGAALYMYLFISEYIKQLNNESFAFFDTNESLLLFTPILFFIGVSMIESFGSVTLSDTKIIGNINLYDVAVNFPNFIFYSIINIYFFKEKQLKK